ncbi:DUF3141 domain-containing protein [Halomonas sp. KO116]|uniref:DUF3141 domain-containing protein n=1 Tax=Halomonas sp. KO116 TaxID=1504981 RepID=UPI0004E3C74C|nr:DUF3141 domain-containing protein [Halomonas sp. KO116]AJY51759.1 Protein of unknown function DUF3141 [Halomonas sp. KO116]
MASEGSNDRPWYTDAWPLLSMAQDYAAAALSYTTDAWQRSILYADVMRQRGDQYQAHLEDDAPHVLDFPYEVVISGHELPRPVNYGLARILLSEGSPPAPSTSKRPFVVVDPRAGHGPGIGGFKAESEVGAALSAGHPCYFIGFGPDPEPGQTIEDVVLAEVAFLEKVIALHPHSEGKPAVVANCQAGWQILMAATLRPELFGPIIVAGTPVSYWAGWPGKNPMRYAGGLLGGSWLTALASDLGNGRFDGAYLVQNFENLNPANTLWGKQYNLYANADSEATRYLGFEKYWGGYVFLNDIEMQYIVDNLFIGNRLSSSELITSEGIRLDLRNIRSPIVVFCSNGDNISPPPQAMGWITDLYRDDDEVLSHDQTIVYATHDNIGHLGIFVSGSVGRKEHREFTNNIDLIDVLPAGIYQTQIQDKRVDMPLAELVEGDYVMSIQRRSVEDVSQIVQVDAENDRKFAALNHISRINLGLYRQFVQPWVRTWTTPESARWLQSVHPLRLSYERWSSRNPMTLTVAEYAQKILAARQPVAADNPFLQWQQAYSDTVISALDHWRKRRDNAYEQIFNVVYGSPWVQAMAGLSADDCPPRTHPGVSPEHLTFVAEEIERLRAGIYQGGLLEASIRALLYVSRFRGEADERRFNLAASLQQPDYLVHLDMASFRQLVRRQANLMRLDLDAATAAIPRLLADSAANEIRDQARLLEQMLTATEALLPEEEASLAQMLKVFDDAAHEQEAIVTAGKRSLGRSNENNTAKPGEP